MKKNQFKQIAAKCGVTTAYSGHTKTFYIAGNAEAVKEFLLLKNEVNWPFNVEEA